MQLPQRYRNRSGRSLVAVLALTTSLLTACAEGTGDDTESDVTYDPEASLSGELTAMGFGAGELDIQQFLNAVASGKPPSIIYATRNRIGARSPPAAPSSR